MVFQSIATRFAEPEYVSNRDGGFKRPLERCKLLTRWAFEYFDQTPTDIFGRDAGRDALTNSINSFGCAFYLIHPRAPVLPPLSVGEMTLRLYAALNYSQNGARDLRRTLNGV